MIIVTNEHQHDTPEALAAHLRQQILQYAQPFNKISSPSNLCKTMISAQTVAKQKKNVMARRIAG